MKPTRIGQIKKQLSKLIDQILRGVVMMITRNGDSLARMVQPPKTAPSRQGGQWIGLVRISDDFDSPLPDEIAFCFNCKTH